MPDSHAKLNLLDVEDQAVGYGLGDTQEARFPFEAIGAQRTGFGHQRVLPGKRQAFAHRHDEAEEIYVVLSGSGRVKLDDEIVELRALDALRVAPKVTRQFEGGPDGIEFLSFGARHQGDGEMITGWWTD